jgi:hypothetical protein
MLARYGEYDWYESRDAASLITRIVNAQSPGRGTFVEIPAMNHDHSEFPNAANVFNETNGRTNPRPAVEVMLNWLRATFTARKPGLKDISFVFQSEDRSNSRTDQRTALARMASRAISA